MVGNGNPPAANGFTNTLKIPVTGNSSSFLQAYAETLRFLGNLVMEYIAVYGKIAAKRPDKRFVSVGFFLAQTATSFVITSGSGMAAVTIPLMSPVADLIGLSRQTLVLAYQMGDGFSNLLLPTTSSLLGTLAVSKVPYGRWVKFMFPLFLLWTVLGCVIMVLAAVIGY